MSIIDEKYDELRTAGAEIGAPLGPEVDAAGGGRSRDFGGGWYIYYHPHIGAAHEVHGAIAELWVSLGRETSRMGYPTSDELPSPHEGRVSHFQRGSIYWDPGRGAYEVWPPPEEMDCDPVTHGRWVTLRAQSGVVGVHVALLHTNQVLFFTYRDPGAHVESTPQLHGASAVLDLDSERVTRYPISSSEANLFCAGQAFLPNGRLLVGGGERGYAVNNEALHTFTPNRRGGSWQRLPDLGEGRWYPTCVTLADGRVAIIGGLVWTEVRRYVNASIDTYSAETEKGLGPRIEAPVFQDERDAATYPFAYTLPDGRLFIHIGTHTHFYDFSSGSFEPTELIAAERENRASRTYNMQGTSVLLPLSPNSSPPYRARIMLFGGGGAPSAGIRDLATDTCELLDLERVPLAWELKSTMPHPRVMPDSVLLPDGTVLVVNGSSTGISDHGANPVYAADLYDPEYDRWATLCNMRVPRLYHATALLLPDGRVMTAGTDSMWNPDPFHEAQMRIEVFSPPYLFRGPQPVIEEAPEETTWNGLVDVLTPDSEQIDKIVLVRNGSCTHSFNSDQRLIELEIAERHRVTRIRWVWRPAPIAGRPIKLPRWVSVPALRVRTPPNGAVAPPGYYMLFLLKNGVPSVARFVRLSSSPPFRFWDVIRFDWLFERLRRRA